MNLQHQDITDHKRRLLVSWGSLLIVYVAVFWASLTTMMSLWSNSANYAHCILIPIISGWLIYRKRHELMRIQQQPSWWMIIPLLGSLVVWLLGISGNVQVVEQLAIVGTLILLVPLLAGIKFAAQITFPLAYLFFAVPFGEQLVPWLQDITAAISVYALQVTGIPVFRNGLFIEIPSGRFLVAEACSGMRYLAASLAIGTLFGYLNYQRLYKRLLFCAFAILVAIVANGIRAYFTIILAHVTDMQYGTGDIYHFVVGWVVYAIIMAMLFWIGSYGTDPEFTLSSDTASNAPTWQSSIKQPYAAVAGVALILLAALMDDRISTIPQTGALASYKPDLIGWTEVKTALDWNPAFTNPDRVFRATYESRNGDQVDLFVADYQYQAQGKELINYKNIFYNKAHWSLAKASRKEISVADNVVEISTSEIRHIDGHKRILWHWYQIGEQTTASKTQAKAAQAINGLLLHHPLARAVIVSIHTEHNQAPEELLEQFISSNWSQLTRDK